MIKSVQVHGVKVSISVEDTGDKHGEFSSDENLITIGEGSKLCPFRILSHEMTHAGLMISGVSEVLDEKTEEAICVAMEGTFGPLLRLLKS